MASIGGLLAARAAASQPNVLIVTIDTLRADAVGKGRGLPALESFLGRATHFTHARTTAPLTATAHVSLFTGLTAAHHGVHDNVGASLPAGRPFPLLAEEYAQAGYDTAGFAAAPVLRASLGVAGGFKTYDCPASPAAESPVDDYGELSAEESANRALEWLKERRSTSPFFLWVHFYDPHDPYLPYAGDPRRAPTTASDSDRERYAGEIRRVDAALERLLAAVPDRTIVVVASDHGESLGEHGERTHGALCYSATSDIFLAVRAPGLRPNASDDRPRSLCDIAPSLRFWCGLDPQPSDGSLLTEPPANLAVVTESLYFWRLHGWGQSFSVSDGRHTLVEGGAALELFERGVDPGEVAPKNFRAEAAFEPLDRTLHLYRSSPVAATSPVFDPTVVTPYGSLRRPESSYLARTENARLANPRTRLSYVAQLDTARDRSTAAIEARDPGAILDAVRELERLAREDSTTALPHYGLVYAYGKLAEITRDPSLHRRAAAFAREVVARGYDVAPALFDLCGQSLLGGDTGDLRAVVEILEGCPSSIDMRVAAILGRVADALESRGEHAHAARARRLLTSRAARPRS